MIGFAEAGQEITHFILDKERGELRAGDFKEIAPLPNPKISFHKSGICKLTTLVGLTDDSIDRCTVIGTPFQKIKEPKLMMEILLPKCLKVGHSKVSERDIVLDASKFPSKPLRCTVVCMPTEKFWSITEAKTRFVSTSEYEIVHALENHNQCWAFVLRISKDDKYVSNRYDFYIPGKIKWGQPA